MPSARIALNNALLVGGYLLVTILAMRSCTVTSDRALAGQGAESVVGAWTFGIMLWLVSGIVFFGRRIRHRHRLDRWLEILLGRLRAYRAYNKVLPRFRFVDLYQAATSLADSSKGWVRIESACSESLAMILNGRFYHRGVNNRDRVEMTSRIVGPGQEQFFPVDSFWVLPAAAAKQQGGSPGLIRVRQGPMAHQSTLEVAARTSAEGTALIERLVSLSAEQSIYRNHLLDLEFAGEIRDDEGNVEQNESFDLVFKPSPNIALADIVLDDEVARALDRNVLDFHRRRDALMALGLPGRRGVLLYGPPGTGKTYTCKYLTSQLSGTITTLVASGESLLRVRTLCNLARMLQPSLVVLEDVDLVFASRESG